MRIPEHIAVIPDGNRRWAVAHGMGKGDGYHYGLRRGFFGTWKYKIPVFPGRIKRVPGAEKSGRWQHPSEFFSKLRLGMGSGAYEKGWKAGVVGCFEDRPRPAVGRQKPPFRAAPDPVCVC